MRSFWPTGGLWRHRDFLKLWSAETISQFGSQVGTARAAARRDPRPRRERLRGRGARDGRVPAVHPLHAAGRRVGRPTAAATDPDRRATSAAPRSSRRSRSRTSPTSLTLGQLFVVGFLVGVFQVFFDVAYQSYLPSLVEREQIIEGNSKLEISRSAAQVGGPGLGGVARPDLHRAVRHPRRRGQLRRLGPLRASASARRGAPAEVATVDGSKSSLWTELKEGLRFVLGNPNLRAQAGCTATSNFFSSVAFSIFLVFAVRELELSAGTIGLDLLGRCRRLARRRLHRHAHLRPLRHRADVDRRRGALRADDSCSSRSRRPETPRFRSSWPRSSSSGSRSSSTTSSR